jgi:hypothetical protein
LPERATQPVSPIIYGGKLTMHLRIVSRRDAVLVSEDGATIFLFRKTSQSKQN